jgi:hypothetical protein
MFRWKTQRLILSSLCVLLVMTFTGCPQPGSVGWVYNAPGDQIGYRVFQANAGELVAVAVQNDAGQRATAYARFGPSGSILADGLIQDLRNPPVNFPKPTATLLSNGDLLLAGTTPQNPPDQEYRLRVLRIDPDGNTLWDFSFGDVELTPKLAVENDAGDILVAGNRTQSGSQLDVFLLLLSADGSIVMFNQLERLEDRSNFAVLADGMAVGESFVLSGWSLTPDASVISVIKLDENAAVTSWARSTGLYASVVGIEPAEDGYAIVASSGPIVQLIRADEFGDVVSVQDDLLSSANPDETIRANDFVVDSSGDIVMVGEGTTVRYVGNFFPQITIRPFIAKFTAEGDRIWERSINVRGVLINGVTETADGGYATTGAAPGPNGDVLLNVIRFDRNGNITN